MAPHVAQRARRRRALRLALRVAASLAAALALAAGPALAQSVVLSGSMGSGKALLLIDGNPHSLAVGGSARGVTLKRVGDGEADVQVGGQVVRLRLGAAPARLDGSGAGTVDGAGGTIVLAAGTGGHFVSPGQINGKAVQFLVDTGATHVALSQSEAARIGLDLRQGQRGLSSTANGTVPVVMLTLNSVRVGGVELANVTAVVVPSEMPMVLLGNSFLNRFSMLRESDTLRLQKRP